MSQYLAFFDRGGATYNPGNKLMAKSQKLRESRISRYTESVKFKSQSRGTASKRKPYRGLGTR